MSESEYAELLGEEKPTKGQIAKELIAVALKCLIALGAFMAVQFVVIIAFIGTGIDYDVYEGLFTLAYSLTTVIIMFLLAKFFAISEKRTLVKRNRPDAGSVIMVLLIGVGMLGIVAIYIAITKFIGDSGNEAVSQAYEEYGQAMDRYQYAAKDEIPAWDHWLTFIATFVIVPMGEELLFRGIIMGELGRKFAPWLSVCISAAIFGLMHGISVQIGYALICGVVLGFVYIFIESIWASYLVHAVFNFFGASLYGLLESGVIDISEESLDSVAEWMGSLELLSIGPAIIAFVLLANIYKRRHMFYEQA